MQKTTMADIERKIDKGELAWGSPKDVADQLIEGAERMGANTLLLNMNVGAMAHDVFLRADPALRQRRAAAAPGASGQAGSGGGDGRPPRKQWDVTRGLAPGDAPRQLPVSRLELDCPAACAQ